MQTKGGRRRIRLRRNQRRALALALIVVVGAGAAVLAGKWSHRRTESSQAADDLEPQLDPAIAAILDNSSRKSARAIYPYSVIPGGVGSALEFQQAREHDAVVASHYPDVSVDRLRVERVTTPRQAYVSYRVGTQVYWTKRKVTLHAGETLLTDGQTTIRGRCGNCVSDVPMEPTSDAEPAASVLEQPVGGAVRDGLPMLPIGTTPFLAAAGLPPHVVASLSNAFPAGSGSPGGGGGGGAGSGLPSSSSRSTTDGSGTTPAAGDDSTPGAGGDTPPGIVPPSDDESSSSPPDNEGPSDGVVPPGPTDGSPNPPDGSTPLVPVEERSVPEPMTLTLMGTGVAWFALRRHRGRGKQ